MGGYGRAVKINISRGHIWSLAISGYHKSNVAHEMRHPCLRSSANCAPSTYLLTSIQPCWSIRDLHSKIFIFWNFWKQLLDFSCVLLIPIKIQYLFLWESISVTIATELLPPTHFYLLYVRKGCNHPGNQAVTSCQPPMGPTLPVISIPLCWEDRFRALPNTTR